jgi:hypothetical protein
MCQKSGVTNTSIILRMLLIVGLVVSPLYPRVFDASGHVATMSGSDTAADETPLRADAEHATLPCHDSKMDGDKACPCMAACMSLTAQALPITPSTPARVAIVGQRFAISSEAQLASLAAPPPARPPRA